MLRESLANKTSADWLSGGVSPDNGETVGSAINTQRTILDLEYSHSYFIFHYYCTPSNSILFYGKAKRRKQEYVLCRQGSS